MSNSWLAKVHVKMSWSLWGDWDWRVRSVTCRWPIRKDLRFFFFKSLLRLFSPHSLNSLVMCWVGVDGDRGGGGRRRGCWKHLSSFLPSPSVYYTVIDRRRKAASQTYIPCISIGLCFGFLHFEIYIISAVKGRSVHRDDKPKTLRYPVQSLVIPSKSGRARNQDRLSSAWWELLLVRADLLLSASKKLKCGVCLQVILELKWQHHLLFLSPRLKPWLGKASWEWVLTLHGEQKLCSEDFNFLKFATHYLKSSLLINAKSKQQRLDSIVVYWGLFSSLNWMS